MAISFPLSLPTVTGIRSSELQPRTVVGFDQSPFTGHQQVYAWPAQWLQFAIELPPMKQTAAAIWAAFFMSLNGAEGTFLLGPSIRKTPGGNISGTVTVGEGAVAGTTTLPLSGGTGSFAVGDWLQVDTGAAARLHRVLKINSGSVDVFPRLRAAYAKDTAISYTSPVGVFRLLGGIPAEGYDSRKICAGMSFTALEAIE